MNLDINCVWFTRTKRTKAGQLCIYTNGKKIGKLEFGLIDTQINVVNLDVDSHYRHRGLGRLLMNIIMSMADDLRRPIFLCSTLESEFFYAKIGMRRVFYHETWNDVKVTIVNHSSKKKLCEICCDCDFVWIPKGMREIRLWI